MKSGKLLTILLGSILLLSLLLLAGCGSGGSPLPQPAVRVTPAEPSSVAEAEAMIGAVIPVPAYLPSSYGIQRIFVYEDGTVVLMFSDGVITDPSLEAMLEPTFWEDEFKRAGGARLVLDMQRVETAGTPYMWEDVEAGRTDIPGDVVDLGQVKGLLVDPREIDYPSDHQVNDIWYLEWSHSKFSFMLRAPKGLPREEVIRIASSVPVLNSP